MDEAQNTRPYRQPKQARSREMVERIVAAAARVLVREGYEKATTNRVAEEAEVSIGSLYQYFPNKDSLMLTLMEQHLAEMTSVFEEKFRTLASADLPDAMRTLIEAAVEAHAVSPELHRVFIEQVPRVGDLDGVRNVESRLVDGLRGYLDTRKEMLTLTDTHLAAFLIVTTVESVTHNAVLNHPDSLQDDRLIDELTVLVLRYLTGRPHHL